MNIEQQWCDQPYCPDFAKIGSPTIKVYSYAERRFYCTTCQRSFSADRGTLFETLRTDRQTILDVMAMLVERNSLRAIGRIKHCKLKTVLHWLDLAGQHTAAVSSYFIRNLRVTRSTD